MPLTRSPGEIKMLYIMNGDQLDASSYEVLDLCEAVLRLVEYVEADARCPCCEGISECSPACAYADDMGRVAGGADAIERMKLARKALKG